MGIVASLAAIPVAEDIIRDERRRELQRLEDERLRRLRESGYRYGDLDLQLIKRYYCHCFKATKIQICPFYFFKTVSEYW